MTMTGASLAQSRKKLGRGRPTYSLTVEGRELPRLISASATYSAGDSDSLGTSEMGLRANRNLEPFQNALATLEVGYGSDLTEWFTGEVQDPRDNHWGDGSEATAWGPYKAMAEQPFLEQVSYIGWDIGDALLDIASRAGMPTGSVEVERGESFVLSGTDAIFPLETMMDDAAASICASASFIGVDLPGFKRVYRPTPRMGAEERHAASYDETSYPPGGFQAHPSRRFFYSRVVVFRREENGALAFPLVDIPIEVEGRRKPRKNRAYIVPEFLGDEPEAVRQGVELAALFGRGTWECSLSGISINPDLVPWKSLSTTATELRDEGGKRSERYEVEYGWQVDGDASVEVTRSARTMELSGHGAKLGEKKLPKPFYVRVKTAQLVQKPPSSDAAPSGIMAGNTEYTIDDLAAYTVEELS